MAQRWWQPSLEESAASPGAVGQRDVWGSSLAGPAEGSYLFISWSDSGCIDASPVHAHLLGEEECARVCLSLALLLFLQLEAAMSFVKSH